MIGYVTVGTNDLKKAGEFYDKLCSELGIGRFMTTDRLIAWGGPGGGAGFGVALPYDGKPMSVGNGVMAAFGAKDKAQVDRVHQLALSLGGTCEGPPGQPVAEKLPPYRRQGRLLAADRFRGGRGAGRVAVGARRRSGQAAWRAPRHPDRVIRLDRAGTQ